MSDEEQVMQGPEQVMSEQRYFQTAVLLSMHRQYEVLLAIAHAAGVEESALQEMITKHRRNQYEVPFEW